MLGRTSKSPSLSPTEEIRTDKTMGTHSMHTKPKNLKLTSTWREGLLLSENNQAPAGGEPSPLYVHQTVCHVYHVIYRVCLPFDGQAYHLSLYLVLEVSLIFIHEVRRVRSRMTKTGWVNSVSRPLHDLFSARGTSPICPHVLSDPLLYSCFIHVPHVAHEKRCHFS